MAINSPRSFFLLPTLLVVFFFSVNSNVYLPRVSTSPTPITSSSFAEQNRGPRLKIEPIFQHSSALEELDGATASSASENPTYQIYTDFDEKDANWAIIASSVSLSCVLENSPSFDQNTVQWYRTDNDYHEPIGNLSDRLSFFIFSLKNRKKHQKFWGLHRVLLQPGAGQCHSNPLPVAHTRRGRGLVRVPCQHWEVLQPAGGVPLRSREPGFQNDRPSGRNFGRIHESRLRSRWPRQGSFVRHRCR